MSCVRESEVTASGVDLLGQEPLEFIDGGEQLPSPGGVLQSCGPGARLLGQLDVGPREALGRFGDAVLVAAPCRGTQLFALLLAPA